jgi:glycyl-tRNA synthetase
VEDTAEQIYLRPETAQGIFVNFKNLTDSMRVRLPFGVGQYGKSFRNEITPGNFIFRTREFEQMEIEYFVQPESWQKHFEYWRQQMVEWMKDIGLDSAKIHELDVPDGERAHYSDKTIDFEYEFPFGKKELYGIAYRTDFDLKSHAKGSNIDLSFYDEEAKVRFVPHVIEDGIQAVPAGHGVAPALVASASAVSLPHAFATVAVEPEPMFVAVREPDRNCPGFKVSALRWTA